MSITGKSYYKNRLDFILFGLFSIIYAVVATELAIPKIDIIRWVISGVLLGISILQQRYLKLPKYWKWLILAIIPSFFIWGDMYFYGLQRVISLFLVIFALSMFLGNDKFSLDDLMSFFNIFMFILVLIMLYNFFRWIQQGLPLGTFSGVYGNKNMLSIMTVFKLCGLIYLMLSSNKNIKYLPLILIAMILIIASGSRAGFLSMILIILGSLFLKNDLRKKSNYIKILAGVIIIIISIFFVVKNVDISAVDRIVATDGSGATGITRGGTWEDVGILVSQKKMFGWGYGTVGYKNFVYNNDGFNWGVHSSYFTILIEVGIVGSILMFAYFWKNFKFAIRVLKSSINEEDRLRIKSLIFICMVFMVQAYAESFLLSVGSPLSIGFWFSFILMGTYCRKIEKQFKVES